MDVNAVENHMTGVIIMQPGFNIVIVEGGPKAIRRYIMDLTLSVTYTHSSDLDV